LNALAKKCCQKALNSAKGLGCPSRRSAGEERVAEVIVAMTRASVFHRGFCRWAPVSALKTSFGLIY
jgi:hypothetical protein